MTHLLVRNLDSQTITCLKNRAKLHNRSLQGEVKFILEEITRLPNRSDSAWAPGFLERVVGGWHGEELTRSTQGHYEQRDELE